MSLNKEELEKAFRAGKTIQSNNSGKWVDFVPQNQVDSPNWEYQSIDNWRVKPDDESSPAYNKQAALLGELANELKKETLQQAQLRFFNEMMSTNPRGGIRVYLNMAIEFGVNWQKEQEQEEDKELYSLKELKLWLKHRDVYLYNHYTTYVKSGIPLQTVEDFIEESHEYLMDRKLFKKE